MLETSNTLLFFSFLPLQYPVHLCVCTVGVCVWGEGHTRVLSPLLLLLLLLLRGPGFKFTVAGHGGQGDGRGVIVILAVY